MTADELPLPLGVSARTGRPLSPISLPEIERRGRQETLKSKERVLFDGRADPGATAFAVGGGLDAADLAQAGWGVLYDPNLDPRIVDALEPLLAHRKREAGDELFHVFEGDSGFRAGDTAETWLARQNGVTPGPVQPELGVPFYLLIVAPPSSISFEFQYALDLYWAVGRVWFETPEEFRRYADSVVAYDTGASLTQSRQVALFAPEHDFDEATQLFNRMVAGPMSAGMGPVAAVGTRQKFRRQPFLGDTATKDCLIRILRGELDGGPPAVLFTGSHGMDFDADDARQAALQGALVCRDWEGYGAIDEAHLFGASAVPADANIHGLIHFLFACHGAGCSEFDDFDRLNGAPRRMANHPMLAALPQRLLSHPNGGALAVVGHVERAWASSFRSPKGLSQTQDFYDVLGRIMAGFRLGDALDTFNLRWAVRSIELAETQLGFARNETVDLRRLANLWVARDDSRNYILFGDPAVRLRVNDLPPLS